MKKYILMEQEVFANGLLSPEKEITAVRVSDEEGKIVAIKLMLNHFVTGEDYIQ